MLHLYDRAAMARALALDLDPPLHRLLTERIVALKTNFGDLTDDTEYLIVQPGDTEADIVRAVGFSPLVDPIDGGRYGSADWEPGFDLVADRGGWFEMIVTFGSTFAYVLFIADTNGVPDDLRALCKRYSRG